MKDSYCGSKQQADDAALICADEIKMLCTKDKEYQGSWKKRPRGVFHMLARKWDRIEHAVESNGDDLLDLMTKDKRNESIQDDIHDLRNYLLLCLLEGYQRVHHVEKPHVCPQAIREAQDGLVEQQNALAGFKSEDNPY